MGNEKLPIITLYTVRRCKLDDTMYGPIHSSPDARFTRCGQAIDHNWMIVTNCFDGNITCKNCKRKIEQDVSNNENK